jgi:hypothetical protein
LYRPALAAGVWQADQIEDLLSSSRQNRVGDAVLIKLLDSFDSLGSMWLRSLFRLLET